MRDFSMWNLNGILNIYLTNHHLKVHQAKFTVDMVKNAISRMRFGKASGPSRVVVEMTRAAIDTGATMIHDLAIIAIIRDGKVPADWVQSFIVCLYQVKGDMLWSEATIED